MHNLLDLIQKKINISKRKKTTQKKEKKKEKRNTGSSQAGNIPLKAIGSWP